MNRFVKAGALATGLVLGGAVAAGAVDLPGLETGNGTTLCYDSKGAVVRPAGSACPARTTPFQVASTAQVDAIEAAHNAAEDRVAALESSNAALTESNAQLAADLVAANGELDALGSELRSAIAALEQRVEAVEPGGLLIFTTQPFDPGASYTYSFTGERLQPGAEIYLHYSNGGFNDVGFIATADSNGSASFESVQVGCEVTNLYVTSTDFRGDPVQSATVVKGAGCP